MNGTRTPEKQSQIRLITILVVAWALWLPSACATDSDPVADAAAQAVDRKPWDAERMTQLSGDLARAVRDVRDGWRREPVASDPSSPHRRSAAEMDRTLRLLDQRTSQLHTRIQNGAGFEETLNNARNIATLLNDLDVLGRRFLASTWMDERVRPAMVLINEIAPYYGSGPLFDPESMQRID